MGGRGRARDETTATIVAAGNMRLPLPAVHVFMCNCKASQNSDLPDRIEMEALLDGLVM